MLNFRLTYLFVLIQLFQIGSAVADVCANTNINYCTPMPCTFRYSLDAPINYSQHMAGYTVAPKIPMTLNLSESCLPPLQVYKLPINSPADILVMGQFPLNISLADLPAFNNLRTNKLSLIRPNSTYKKWFETSPPNCVYVDKLGVRTEHWDATIVNTYLDNTPLPPNTCISGGVHVISRCGVPPGSGQWDIAPADDRTCHEGCTGPDLRTFRHGSSGVYFTSSEAADCSAVQKTRWCADKILSESGDFGSCTTPGICGSSQGNTFASAPVSNLCSQGKATAVIDGANWSWSCTSLNGGTTANCAAQKPVVMAGQVNCYGGSSAVCVIGGGCNVADWNNYRDWAFNQLIRLGYPDPYSSFLNSVNGMSDLNVAVKNSAVNVGERSQTGTFVFGDYRIAMRSDASGRETNSPGSFIIANEGILTETSTGLCPAEVVCGAANGGPAVTETPTVGLCSKASVNPLVTLAGGRFTWTCGVTACSVARAPAPIGAYCEWETYLNLSSTETTGQGSLAPGQSKTVYSSPPKFTFGCFTYGGARCDIVNVSGTDRRLDCILPIDGVCGTADGKTLSAAPSTAAETCASSNGLSSAVQLQGSTWSWGCAGFNGGNNASCAATKQSTTCIGGEAYTWVNTCVNATCAGHPLLAKWNAAYVAAGSPSCNYNISVYDTYPTSTAGFGGEACNSSKAGEKTLYTICSVGFGGGGGASAGGECKCAPVTTSWRHLGTAATIPGAPYNTCASMGLPSAPTGTSCAINNSNNVLNFCKTNSSGGMDNIYGCQ